MAVYGSLDTMPLADILQWIKTTARSGLLTVFRDGTEWELVVEGGTVSGYRGPELHEDLGQIVVTSGLLTEEDLRRAYGYQREHGGTLRNALLHGAMIAADDLEECLTELATESLYDLFVDLPGEFVFSETSSAELSLDLDEPEERLELDVDINHLLMEGARRQDEWQMVRDRFPHDDLDVIVSESELPDLDQLGVRQRRILASVSAGQSITDLCFELRVPTVSVLRTLLLFETRGGVAVRDRQNAGGEGRESRLGQFMAQAEYLRQSGQFDEAISLLEVAVRMRPDSERARLSLRETFEEQIKDLYATLPPLKVPHIVVGEERIRRLRLRPEERFLVNRLGAHMDVGSLIMVSSLNERETLKTLKKLLHGGIIELR